MKIKEKISLESKVVQNPGNIVSDMDGEKVMLNIENGKYYNLGDIGGVIWELILEPITLDNLVNQVMRVYEVEQTECQENLLSFVTALYIEGLIEIVN